MMPGSVSCSRESGEGLEIVRVTVIVKRGYLIAPVVVDEERCYTDEDARLDGVFSSTDREGLAGRFARSKDIEQTFFNHLRQRGKYLTFSLLSRRNVRLETGIHTFIVT